MALTLDTILAPISEEQPAGEDLSYDNERAELERAFESSESGDDGDGVDPAWLDGHAAVGITAGASAPDELVDSVIAALRRFRPVTVSQLDGVEENVEFSLPPELRRPNDMIQAAAE